MKKTPIIKLLDKYRFEFLLISLCLLLFNKVFFPDNEIYLKVVWPMNMLILNISSIGLFRDRVGQKAYYIKNTMALTSIVMPFAFELFSNNRTFMSSMMIFFIIYYSLLFFETLSQIIKRSETNISVVLGSVCGYLLLVLIALFNFLLIELVLPNSFQGIHRGDLGQAYNDLSYFTFTLITSTGFGDITPMKDSSRLAACFFSVLGQFYMVALVGIIVSRFNASTKHNEK